MLIKESTEQPTACGNFIFLKRHSTCAELIAESEEEFLPELVGDEEAGLYFYTEESIYEEEDPYFETIGEGPSKVLMRDIFCHETTETHGHRVRDTFLTFALSDNFTLFAFGATSGIQF